MDAHSLITAFQRGRGDDSGYHMLDDFLRLAPIEEIEKFAFDALSALPKGGNFYQQTLSHISPAAFERVITQALALLERGESKNICDEVFFYASMQFLPLLQPHLDRLFTLQPNERAFYENWPWRGALDADVAFLCGKLESGTPAERSKAFECLMETRQPKAMSTAMAAYHNLVLRQKLSTYVAHVDHAAPGQPLFEPGCTHLVFPASYFNNNSRHQELWAMHPTRTMPSDAKPVRFGGEGAGLCGYCGQPRHHLVTLPEKYIFTGAGEADLSLECCLSCMGWECPVMFYRHGADGLPVPLDHASVTPKFPVPALIETQVTLAPTPPRWQWQSWGSIGENINRIGGAPTWIQSAQYPDCPCCGDVMHFALQLDGDFPMADDGEWAWGSGGLGYGFQCTPCRVTGFTWQCT